MGYFELLEVRRIVAGNSSSEELDQEIQQEGAAADVDVENDISQFSGVTPPYTGTDLTVDIVSAANWKTAHRVFIMLRLPIQAANALEVYNSIIKSITISLTGSPNTVRPLTLVGSWQSLIIQEEEDGLI